MSSHAIPRRTLLQGALVATAAAFNPVSRSWAASPEPGTVSLPPLDGQLLMDAAARTRAADDFGHSVHRTPWAVLVPGSVKDIVKLVRFARAQRLKVAAARGLGESHSTYGQAQVDAGVIIDMSALSTIHEVDETSAWVDAGVRWIQLLQATTPLGKSPPTLTDYIDLSIGGTLSVGGIGGQVFRWGLQVDNVLELEVVTGTGELVRCSPSRKRPLFDAVRGGLGQFGIIVKARIRLVPVPPRARTYTALYKELSLFLKDQKQLAEDGRFDYVEGFVVSADGGRAFQLEAVKYFAEGAEPQDATLLAGLSFQPATLQVKDSSYFDFVNRLAPVVAFLQSSGAWQLPHPWIDMLVPEKAAEAFVEKVLAETPDADMGQGPILLYAVRPPVVTAPFARVPAGKTAFLFSLLRTAVPPTPENVAALTAKNQEIFQQLVAVGGKRYGAGSIPMSAADWREHFQPFWERFQRAKRSFDPDNILTPGQGIFS
ncbi:FAD-binding protein [Vitiosangium sp. GDMCC 1.1324]|uniref:FAD-binding protein n=1 Tax=Vitiosangium sp. (strain GDMCC 1.1324) TaxID=2138576 RepID=UPI000D35A491|nr:FAD-binding protein [Vitiosangium sp. GDMCC 1.1324]PTL77470.1 oxidoreductase [Vitiosangium sp. GDMCC 1.1324]